MKFLILFINFKTFTFNLRYLIGRIQSSMHKKSTEGKSQKSSGYSKKSTIAAGDNMLHQLAFDNSFQAHIISTVSSKKILSANSAACKLLGYSKKELLTKSQGDILNINETSFKNMLKQRNTKGQSIAFVTAIKKSGELLRCQITSAVFMDKDGNERSITTITDMSQSILKQKNIDSEKEKIVADNIAIAIAKQIDIDAKNKKIVADNILLAIANQIDIDVKNEKIVADNIALAISNQKNIDVINAKAVDDNIILALLKQKKIDTKKEKVVADNIALAQSKQKKIDTKKEKIVADNIILAQTESDARLVENNELIKYIARSSYDVMWDWHVATGQINVSDSIEEVFGYKVQYNTVNFSDVSRCLLPEEKDTVEKKLFETLTSGNKTWNDAFKVKRHDGSVASTTSRASIIRDKKGKAVRLVGAIQDVSRLQELENKLEEQITIQVEHSETFFLAAKITSDVIWDWDLLTNELFIGEGFEEMYGYSPKNKRGNIAITDWSDLHPDDKETVEKGLYAAIASSDVHWEHSYRFIRADGSIAKGFNRASIFRHSDGKAYRMIGAMQDITERKKTEREKELMIKELLKSNADLKQFSYITSHNLRAPLSNIESILSIIDYSTLDTANAEMLKMLNTSGKQLSKTIEDLTKILVIKNNGNAEIRTISLPEAFIHLNDIFSVALNEVGAKVFTDFTDPEIDFNETYLESILINLFSNAIKYRSPHRNLVIHASSKYDANGNTIFRFSDNGTGIDVIRHKDRLFGLYQRFHDTTDGNGLGLYIIKSQIDALDGKIEIESEPDKGTAFIITFKKKSPGGKKNNIDFLEEK